ncbi:MAG TPA: non-homologous end-joining DNA ligase [Dehalococcoidia bacterium]|nr:non-homologous end-joining DNA ligase [Dehalococcoidia bacterium]
MALAYPQTLRPMLASLVAEPFDSARHLFEVKWDGMRVVAFIENGQTRLQSRNEHDVTVFFPELGTLPKQLAGRRAIIDGEVVSFRDGKPSFAQLQYRLGIRDGLASSSRAVRADVSYQAFDLLYLDDRELLRLPLEDRKALLSEHFGVGDYAQPCDFILEHGRDFMGAIEQQGLEGMIAKDRTSQYTPGKRSAAWQKIKVRRSGDFVIGGYTFGAGYRSRYFGALMLGIYDERGALQFVGTVGGGFTDTLMRELTPILEKFQSPDRPFAELPKIERFSFWCIPRLVCKVTYAEFTDQRRLRFPIFESMRPDVDPVDCTFAALGGEPAAIDTLV